MFAMPEVCVIEDKLIVTRVHAGGGDRTDFIFGQIDGREPAPLRPEALEFFVLVGWHEIAGDLPVAGIAAGERASYRFFEFFTAQIRNPNTRRAYARAAVEFFDWLAARGMTRLTAGESVHVGETMSRHARRPPRRGSDARRGGTGDDLRRKFKTINHHFFRGRNSSLRSSSGIVSPCTTTEKTTTPNVTIRISSWSAKGGRRARANAKASVPRSPPH
jgi:hypothetical protein